MNSTRSVTRHALALSCGIAALPAALATAAPALAQETTVGEVVVTAQKRSENLQDVPVSVASLDGEQLETRGVVVANEEKNGHLIVTLDFTVSSRERLAMSGRHWAIYAPRQVREKA